MQRTKHALIAVILVTGVVALAAAQNTAAALENAGYRVLTERSEGGMPTWDVEDEQGRRFAVSVLGNLTRDRRQALDAMHDVIYGLEGLEIQRLRFVFERDRADAVVIPSRYRIDGRDYVRFMPSGMQFRFDGSVAYDFRLLVDNLAVRINGQFLSEEQFVTRIQRAVANPAAYIQSQDPQFLARRLDEQQARIDANEFALSQQETRDEELTSSLEDLETRAETAITEQVRRGERAIAQLDRELSAQIADGDAALRAFVEEQIAAVRADQEETAATLETELTDLREEFEAMRRGAIILASRNIFGNLKAVDPSVILQAVSLRAEDPDAPADEIVDQVNEGLAEDAEPLHGKHMQAIDAYYFNRYE